MTQWWYLISQLFLSHTIAFHVGLSELKQGHFASEHLKLLFSKILYSKMAPCGRAAICLMPNAASACQVIDRFIFWFWESPTTGWHLPGQKHLHFLIIWFIFYLICSTTAKWFAQLYIFPNPSFVWCQSAVIGWFNLKQCLWQCCCVTAIMGKQLVLTLQKLHLVANNEFAFSFRPTPKLSFPNKWAGNMLMVHVDVDMKWLGGSIYIYIYIYIYLYYRSVLGILFKND